MEIANNLPPDLNLIYNNVIEIGHLIFFFLVGRN